MPKHQLENQNRAQADRRALAERREAVNTALQELPARNAAEQRDLFSAQDAVMRTAAERNDKLAPVLAEQQRRLETIQTARVDLINKALDAAARVEKNGADGPTQALQIVNTAAELNRSLTENERLVRETENNRLRETLAVTESRQRDARIVELVDNQARNRAMLDRDIRVALSAVERKEALAMNALNEDSLGRLRSTIIEAVNSDKLPGLLSNDALQRLANEALVPGRERLQDVSTTAAVQRVKGELAEQVAAALIAQELKQENQARTEQQKLYFVAGERVRDDMGKLSDGLMVWRDHQDQLRIWAAIEVKSGAEAARELNNEKLSGAARAAAAGEKRDYQQDAGPDANLVNAGQLNQTAERLRMATLGGRLYIDHRPVDALLDRDRQSRQDFVRAYVTDDAVRSEETARRLNVQSQELEAMARAFVEELLRQRESDT